jgi:acetyl-CoA synthetase
VRIAPGRWASSRSSTTRSGASSGQSLILDRRRKPPRPWNESRAADAFRNGWYHTGDVARRDEDGYITYVGRADDVFKSSDYRISPFELESALVEHPSVAEAAVVPAPDPMGLTVPKAFVMLRPGVTAGRDAALALFRFVRERLAPYKRVRRIEFAELPKTISGKIRRVELRKLEDERASRGERSAAEFRDEDFPELVLRPSRES